eukprot:GHVS01025570.1.p1 GENE.GHVS01025570.1~~GHVS01025570.1.p1  ORF type:complete len:421 (+),score=87.29 GHVS01025570.1:147-1265(+)
MSSYSYFPPSYSSTSSSLQQSPPPPSRLSCINSLFCIRLRQILCCWFCPRDDILILPSTTTYNYNSRHNNNSSVVIPDSRFLSCSDIVVLTVPILSSMASYLLFLYYLIIVPLMQFNIHPSQHIYGYIELSLVLLSLMAALTSTSVSRALYQLERSAVRSLVGAQISPKSMCLQKWTATFTSVVGLLLLLCYSTVQPIELVCNGVLMFGCCEHLVWSGLTFVWSVFWISIILRASRMEAPPTERIVVDAYGRAIMRPSTYIYSSSPSYPPHPPTVDSVGHQPPIVGRSVCPVAIGLPVDGRNNHWGATGDKKNKGKKYDRQNKWREDEELASAAAMTSSTPYYDDVSSTAECSGDERGGRGDSNNDNRTTRR